MAWMTPKGAWTVVKQTFKDFFEMSILKLSSALAYYTVFSLPGLLIIIIWVSDLFYGRKTVEMTVYHQVEAFMGHSVADDMRETISGATAGSGNSLATIIGLIALVIGATTVFGEIQDSINRIWRVKAKPRKGFAILKMVFNRLISLSMIVTLGFLLLVSLLINGALDFLLGRLMERYPDITVVLIYVLNGTITFFITASIFAAIFKVLPDARIKWRHVWVGAFVTAALFMLGRFVITYYLGHNRMTTTYGAAGSIIVVLLWVYYSSMILYFGAAFTHAYVIYKGSRIYPNSYAVWVQQIEVESESSIRQQPTEKTVIQVPPPPKQTENKNLPD